MANQTRKTKILLVEDDPSVTATVRTALEAEGYDVFVAASAESAIKTAGAERPDLCVLDLLVPGVDGVETCGQLKALYTARDVPVIFMSESADAFDKLGASDLGAVDHLSKPIRKNELLFRVRTGLNISRLAELVSKTGWRMQEEISKRVRAEAELQRALEDAERRVNERTGELSRSSERLRREVTDLRRKEVELRESENTLKTILATSPIGIGLAADRKMKWVNEAWTKMFGFEHENEFLDRDARMLYPSDEEYSRVGAALYEDLPTGRVTETDVRFRRKDGSVFDAHVCMNALDPSDLAKGTIAAISDISARKQAEEALRESERLLAIRDRIARLFLTVPDDEVHGEVLGVVLRAMDSKDGVFGYIDDDGTLVCLFMTRDDSDQCRILDKGILFPRETWGGLWGRTLLEKKALCSNEPLEVPQGHIAITRALAVPIVHSGDTVGLLLAANKETDYSEMDVSLLETIADYMAVVLRARLQTEKKERERKSAEEALRESEERFRGLSEAAEEGIAIHDHGEIVDANEAFAKMFGYPISELVGMSAEKCTTPDTWKTMLEHVATGYDRPWEGTGVRKDGSTFPCQLVGKPFQYRGKALWVAVFRDVSERKRAEEELRKSEEKYRTIIETIEDGYYEVDLKGRFTAFNDRVCEIWGYSADELMGMDYRDYTDRKDAEEAFRVFNTAYREGKAQELLNYEIMRKDGSKRSLEVSVSLVEDPQPGGAVFYGIIRDITERRRQEEELRKAKDAAEAANRAKSEFLASMSHELRTPLNSILGYAQLLKRDGNLTDTQRHQLIAVQSSGEHLLTLISDILDLSRIEAQKTEVEAREFDLPELIHTVLGAPGVKAREKNISLQYEEGPDLPRVVKGDSRKLRQVLLNLLDNAIKYTQRGSVILRVFSSGVPVPSAEETRRNLPSGESSEGGPPLAPSQPARRTRLTFQVTDTGVGIPEKKMGQIFEPFMRGQTDGRVVEGIGLGLAICRKLVDLMGGSVSVESEPGRGSTFTVGLDLDVVEGVQAPAGEPERAVVGYEGESKKVLVVDDNVSNQSMLVSLLEPLGFEVHTAETGAQAIEIATALKPDLMLLDLLMPGMDGREVVRSLRAQEGLRDIKVIGVSAAVADKVRTEEFAAQCDDFISKPLEVWGLLDRIGERLQIHWIEGEAQRARPAVQTDTSRVEDAKPAKFPPRAILKDIIDKVDRGDFTGLKRTLEALTLEDEVYTDFCRKIQNHAGKYDDESILEYLASQRKGINGGPECEE